MRLTKRAKSLMIVAVAAMGLLSMVPGSASANVDRSSADHSARATLRDASGAVVGRVQLTSADGSLLVSGRFQGLTPGFHGFHVHAVGRCEPPFTSAGGHHNPGATGHGQHDGDMPVLLVQQDGTAVTVTETDRVDLAELVADDGSAIVVHAGPDNLANIPARYTSSLTGQPGPDTDTLATGDAGARVACGVVNR